MLKLKLFSSLIVLSMGFLLIKSANAQTSFSGVEFSSPTLDSVDAGNGKLVPVYQLKQGEKLTINFNYTLNANSSGFLRLNRISDSPFNCQTSGMIDGKTLTVENNCAVSWKNGTEGGNILGKFVITPKSVSLGGDFEINIEASGVNNFSSKVFILRLENFNQFLGSPADCSIANPGHAVFIPSGGSGVAIVDVGVPFSLYKTNTITIGSESQTGIFIQEQSLVGSFGVGLVVPISLDNSLSAGTYQVNLDVGLTSVPKKIGHCALFVVVEPALTDVVVEPNNIGLEVNQSVPVQILAKLQDGQTKDVSISSSLEIINPPTAKLADGRVIALKEGEGDIKFTLPDIWSDSGRVIEKTIHVKVSQPKDFSLNISPDIVVRAGSTVVVPLVVECLGGFNDEVRDIKFSSGEYGLTVSGQVIDKNAKEVSKISDCHESYFLRIQISGNTQPLSENPPFDKPLPITLSARGEHLVTDLGFGNGVRMASTQLVVLKTLQLKAELQTPIQLNSTSKLVWESKFAESCFLSGDVNSSGNLPIVNANGLNVGPFKETGKYKLLLTCTSSYGGEVSQKLGITVEDKIQATNNTDLLNGSVLDNSTCRQITISWPSQPDVLSYRLYRDVLSSGKTKQLIATSTQGTIFKDTNLPELTPEYYWLDIITSQGVIQKYLGSSGVRSCSPDISFSDMEIIQVDYVDLQTVPLPCNGVSERLQNSEVPVSNVAFSLKINLCNTGQGNFDPDTLTLDLSYLTLVGIVDQVTLTSVDSNGKLTTQIIPSQDYKITQDATKTSLVFKKLPVIYAQNASRAPDSLLLRLKPFLPKPTTLSVYQFTARADLVGSYIKGDKQPQSLETTFSLPLYQFYSSGRAPIKSEK